MTVFNEQSVGWWIYNLSKMIVDNPKDSRNGKRGELAVVLNALEKAEDGAEAKLQELRSLCPEQQTFNFAQRN